MNSPAGIDDAAVRQALGAILDPETGRRGVKTYIAGDKMGQGHTDQWMGYLSDCKLSLDEKIIVEGEEHTVADYIEQMKLDVHKNALREYSWTLMALSAYYPSNYEWTAGDGQTWSIPKLVEIELEHDLNESPCGGTHRMTALTMVYNRHIAAGGAVDGIWKTLEERIAKCVADARQFQNPDGSLSSNYFLRPGKSADLANSLGSAGHTLEFVATALDKDELQAEWVKRAVLDVCKLFRKTRPIDVESARIALKKAPGVALVDHRADEGYVTPVESTGEDPVYVSRIRQDPTIDNGLSLWIVADNLRKGAALNAVQIAEALVAEHLPAKGKAGRTKVTAAAEA